MGTPDISVVMSVYNGAAHLGESVDSILSQDGVDFEFVIVDDGSTDATPQILAGYAARDPRIQLIRQGTQGLTRALIHGCTAARGIFIARQDADDVALPGRLARQLSEARHRPAVALVSCGSRCVGPNNEFLFDTIQDAQNATEHLLTLDPDELKGPSSHGATMYPAALYRRVGGYRPEFVVAQDLDLWVRMAEQGGHFPIAEVLQRYRCALAGISSGTSKLKKAINRIILDSARLRRAGQDDRNVIDRIHAVVASFPRGGPKTVARSAYFIGACLMKRDATAARSYFRTAIRHDPLNARSWFRLTQTLVMK